MTTEEFVRIASEYEGKIVYGTNDDFFIVKIENENEICSYYDTGEIHRKQTVHCTIRLTQYGIGGEEKTYAILGGFSTRADEETLRYYLNRYKFKKKQGVQLSLF